MLDKTPEAVKIIGEAKKDGYIYIRKIICTYIIFPFNISTKALNMPEKSQCVFV